MNMDANEQYFLDRQNDKDSQVEVIEREPDTPANQIHTEQPVEQPVESPVEREVIDISGNTDPEGDNLQEPGNQNITDSNSTFDYLRSKNIDPNGIKFTNDDGSIDIVPFGNLSKNEQIDVLNNASQGMNLDQNESSMINYFRQNNITLEDYTNNAISQSADYLNTQKEYEPEIDIDNMSDDDVYKAFAKGEDPNLTDLEVEDLMDAVKTNPTVFDKKILNLRNNYKTSYEESAKNRLQQEQYNLEKESSDYIDNIVNFSNSNLDKSFYGVDLDVNEHQEIVNFLVKPNAIGQTGLEQYISTPEGAYTAATLLTQGPKIMELLRKENGGQFQGKPSVVTTVNNQNEIDDTVFDKNEQFFLKRRTKKQK